MRRTLYISIISLVLLQAILYCPASAQHPVATVNLNLEKLNQENKDKLANLKQDMEQYINNYDWTDNTHRYDIPIQIDVFLERAQPTSFEDRYDARIVFSNATDYQQSDKRWTFAYRIGIQLPHAGQFHSLSGMLDFYIYILLGQEYDKISKLGGTQYYEKAQAVVQQSKFHELFESGWKERQVKIEKLLSKDNEVLRELEYYFIQAKQWFRLDNRKTAGQYLKVIVIKLQALNPEMEGLERYFQLHHLDIARFLSQLGMRTELAELKKIDRANEVTYQQFIDQIP